VCAFNSNKWVEGSQNRENKWVDGSQNREKISQHKK
jgi:hypothetical protein